MSQIAARIFFSMGEVLNTRIIHFPFRFFNNFMRFVSHRWVFHFAHLHQLPVLVPFIPTENPRLRDTAYEVCKLQRCLYVYLVLDMQFGLAKVIMKVQVFFFFPQVALVALATNPSFHKDLLSTVKSWPPVIYSTLPVISAIEPQLNTSSVTDVLKEVSMVDHKKS